MADKAASPNGSYNDNGFEFFKGLVEPDTINALLNMTEQVAGNSPSTFRGIIRKSTLTNKLIYVLQGTNFVPLDTFHWGLTPFVSRVVGKPVLPAYSNFRIYQHGDVCKVHSDRVASEHGISLMIGSSDNKPWGLSVGHEFIEDPMNWRGTGEVKTACDDFGDEPYSTFEMCPGDAVLYQAINRRHGRLKPNPNRWTAHLFMFWVDKDGPRKDQAFDKKRHPPTANYTF